MITTPPAVGLRVKNVTDPPRPMKCLGRLLPPNLWVDVDWTFYEQFGGTRGLQWDFSGAAETLQTHTSAGRLTFDWWCPLSEVDGYGRHALAIYRSLWDLGVEPVLRDVGWKMREHLSPEIESQADYNAFRPPCRIAVCMSVPYDQKICHNSSVYKIAVTQFETDTIPRYHVKQVNQTDHLIVTSSFQPEVWRRSGVRPDIPISVMTPGVDTDFFAFRERPRDGHFKVLILGALTARKDPLGAVKIFQEASQGNPDWRFTIKTRQGAGNADFFAAMGFKLRQTWDEDSDKPVTHIPNPFWAQAPIDPRITVVMSDDSPEEVREWYWSHNCLLWPSRGEGVGLPPLEAMSTGMEVVMANNSGMADYAHDDVVWPIPTHHMEPADHADGFSEQYVKAFGQVGKWWIPDHAVAVAQLRAGYEAWRQDRGKGVRAAEYVRAHHTVMQQAQSVLEVIQPYA